MSSLKELLEYRLLEFQSYSLTVASLLGAALIYFVAWLAMRFFRRMLEKGNLLRDSWDTGRRHSLYLLLKYIVWLLSVTAMLEMLGVHVSVLVAGSAALLVGLGLGVQQIFKDIVSGIFLLFEGTIEVGDVMEVDGKVGRVHEINLRTSKLVTRDGLMMIVPNHKFITENVTNWSHGSEQAIRFQVIVGVSYDADEQLVREQLLSCAREHPDVILNDPARAPLARLLDFGDSALIFELLFWTLKKFESDNVRSDIRFDIRRRFRESGILIPFPQTELTIKSTPEQSAKESAEE